MRTITSKFSVKSEEKLKKMMGRISALQGAVSLSVEKIYPPKRSLIGRISDWFANEKRSEEPEILYSFSADSALLIDGHYDPDSVAEQLMRLLPSGSVASITEIDPECGERRVISISGNRRIASSEPV